MPGIDTDYIQDSWLNLFYLFYQGITYFMRCCIPYHRTGVVGQPFSRFDIFKCPAIKVCIAAEDVIFYIILVFFHQVSDRLNGAAGTKGREKPGYGDENFQIRMRN